MKFPFPAMFLAIWQFLLSKIDLNRDFSKLAIGIPRGFAKTTLMKLWIIYVILFTDRKFILIISNSQQHTVNIIKDVCDMLSHSNIRNLFGDWMTNKEVLKQELKVFTFRGRRIILAGMGAESSVRGFNVGNARPDVMIFEDYQPKEESENPDISKALYIKMLGTHMKAKAFDRCLTIFVANMYPTVGSILKKLKKNPDWLSFIVGGIRSDGTSLWEDLQPISQLIAEYLSDLNAQCPEIFFAEVLNDENAGIKAGIDITLLPKNPFEDEEEAQGGMIIIDPALDKITSDYNGIGRMMVYDGIPVLVQVELGRFSPGDLIKNALIMAIQNSIRVIGVENVAYQASLIYWFNETCKINGISGMVFVPITMGIRSKNAKIRSGLKGMLAKELYVAEAAWPNFSSELIIWNPMSQKNEDTTLDLMSMMPQCIKDFAPLMEINHDLYKQFQGATEVISEFVNSPF